MRDMIRNNRNVLSLLLIVALVFIAMVIYNNKGKIIKTVKNDKTEYEQLVTIENGNEIPDVDTYVTSGTAEGKTIEYRRNDKPVAKEDLTTGEYLVVIDGEVVSKLVIKDTTAPDIVLRNISINYGSYYRIGEFIESCTDNSGTSCMYSYKEDEMGRYKEPGSYNIVIIVKDESGNSKEASAKLEIYAKGVNLLENRGEGAKTETTTKASSNATTTKTPVSTTKKSTTTKPQLVSSEAVEENSTEPLKYGTVMNIHTTYDLKVYSDGSSIRANEKTTKTLDVSGYNATVNDLLAEASLLVNNNNAKANEMLGYVNQYRQEVSVPDLVLDPELSKLANMRALELAYTGADSAHFSHTRPNGSSCFTIYDEMGYISSYKGENIFGGNSSTSVAADNWRHSQGHYENMIKPQFTKIGVGVVTVKESYLKTYWVQLFA